MPTKTVIYRGPSGTTIAPSALEAALAKQDMRLVLHRDRASVPMPPGTESHFEMLPPTAFDPCRAEIYGNGSLRDAEDFIAREQVEGLARVLRRVLPERAKGVVAHISNGQGEQ